MVRVNLNVTVVKVLQNPLETYANYKIREWNLKVMNPEMCEFILLMTF